MWMRPHKTPVKEPPSLRLHRESSGSWSPGESGRVRTYRLREPMPSGLAPPLSTSLEYPQRRKPLELQRLSCWSGRPDSNRRPSAWEGEADSGRWPAIPGAYATVTKRAASRGVAWRSVVTWMGKGEVAKSGAMIPRVGVPWVGTASNTSDDPGSGLLGVGTVPGTVPDDKMKTWLGCRRWETLDAFVRYLKRPHVSAAGGARSLTGVHHQKAGPAATVLEASPT